MMKEKIYSYLRNRSIHTRVHRYHLIVAIVSLIFITVISISIFSQISMTHLSESEGQSLYYYAKNIENKLYLIDDEIIQITQKPENQDFLYHYLITDDFSRYQSIRTLKDEIIHNLSMSDSIAEVLLFTNNFIPISIYSGEQTEFDINDFDYQKLLGKTVSEKNHTIIEDGAAFSISQQTMTDGLVYAKRITDLKNETVNIGYIVLYIKKAQLFEFENNPSPKLRSFAQHHIVSNTGSMVFSNNTKATGENVSELIRRIIEEDSKNNNYFFAGSKYPYSRASMCVFSSIDVLDSYVVTTIPYTFFASELLPIAGLLFMFTVLLAIVSNFISVQITRSMLVPINDLLTSLKAIAQSDFSVPDPDTHQDELADLRNLLNDTTERLADLFEQVKFAERQKFLLQFKALQAQINPHFLINTLNTVTWLADLQGANNIKKITSSLILILNNILKDESKVITIRQEVDLLRKYITIQNFKFFDRFNVSYRIDDAVLDHYILKFILQPIVENCILHGMTDNTAVMNVSIEIFKKSEKLNILIKDDGVGMSKERIQEVLGEDPVRTVKKNGLPSIGLSNINSRIKLFYGDIYHLKILSSPGEGTTIKISIPLNQEGDLND